MPRDVRVTNIEDGLEQLGTCRHVCIWQQIEVVSSPHVVCELLEGLPNYLSREIFHFGDYCANMESVYITNNHNSVEVCH